MIRCLRFGCHKDAIGDTSHCLDHQDFDVDLERPFDEAVAPKPKPPELSEFARDIFMQCTAKVPYIFDEGELYKGFGNPEDYADGGNWMREEYNTIQEGIKELADLGYIRPRVVEYAVVKRPT